MGASWKARQATQQVIGADRQGVPKFSCLVLLAGVVSNSLGGLSKGSIRFKSSATIPLRKVAANGRFGKLPVGRSIRKIYCLGGYAEDC